MIAGFRGPVEGIELPIFGPQNSSSVATCEFFQAFKVCRGMDLTIPGSV
jgi:hypothetical protein